MSTCSGIMLAIDLTCDPVTMIDLNEDTACELHYVFSTHTSSTHSVFFPGTTGIVYSLFYLFCPKFFLFMRSGFCLVPTTMTILPRPVENSKRSTTCTLGVPPKLTTASFCTWSTKTYSAARRRRVCLASSSVSLANHLEACMPPTSMTTIRSRRKQKK